MSSNISSQSSFFKRKFRKSITVDDITIVNKKLAKKAVYATMLGNAMEWFDFGVYSFLAVVIGKVFFSAEREVMQIIATFATFSVAFLVRPLGGVVFGFLGDKIGRKKTLAFTMIMMAIGTFFIGLLPDYNSIGIVAPILLMACRLLQGFSTGGEYCGATTFIAEYSADKDRGYRGSWLEFGSLLGYLLGAIIVIIINYTLTAEQILNWGWRIPFLLSAPVGLIGVYIRTKLEETPVFQEYLDKKENGKTDLIGLKDIIINYWKSLILCIGLVLLFNVSNYMLTAYMPSYLDGVLGLGPKSGLKLIIMVLFVIMPLTLLFGKFNDKIGRKTIVLIGSLGLVVLAIPALLLIREGTDLSIFLGLMVLGVLHTCFSSTMPSVLPSLFSTKIRYSALAIGFNLSVSLFGGTTPLIVSWLVNNISLMMPAYYLMGAGIIGIISVYFMKETAQKPLQGSAPIVATQKEAHALVKEINKNLT